MKNTFFNLFATCMFVLSAHSAHSAETADFNANDLLSASDAALKTFAAENPDHASHLTGFKVWKTGVDAKVKIYVLHGSAPMEINYLCIKSANQVHCSRN